MPHIGRWMLVGLLTTAGAWAQGHRGAAGTGPIGQGFGNVVFPGTGIPRPSGHIPNLGSTIRGVWPAGVPTGPAAGPVRQRAVIPVAVPVFVGGYGYGYGYDYAAPQQMAPQVTVINAPQPSPTVIINQNYAPDQARPVMRDYTREQLPQTPGLDSYQAPVPSHPEPAPKQVEDKATIYLIGFNDGTVVSCYAYWVEGETLSYITTKYARNKVSLSMVDAAVSEQLNRERKVEFSLKPSR